MCNDYGYGFYSNYFDNKSIEKYYKNAVAPEYIKNSFFDTFIVITEFIDEIKSTMKKHNITYANLIYAVQV